MEALEAQQTFEGGIKTRADRCAGGRTAIRVWGGHTPLTLYIFDAASGGWMGEHTPPYGFGLRLQAAYHLT